MGAPFVVERGIDPSEEGLGAALIMRLLLDLPEGRGYFRSLADQPTLAKCRDETRKPNLGTDLSWLRDRTHTRLQILDESACKWCDFGNACGENVSEQAAAKQGDTKLVACRRLVAHV